MSSEDNITVYGKAVEIVNLGPFYSGYNIMADRLGCRNRINDSRKIKIGEIGVLMASSPHRMHTDTVCRVELPEGDILIGMRGLKFIDEKRTSFEF